MAGSSCLPVSDAVLVSLCVGSNIDAASDCLVMFNEYRNIQRTDWPSASFRGLTVDDRLRKQSRHILVFESYPPAPMHTLYDIKAHNYFVLAAGFIGL